MSPPLALIGAIAAPYRSALGRSLMWTFLPWLLGRLSFGKAPVAAVSCSQRAFRVAYLTLLAEARKARPEVAIFPGPGS